MTCFVNIAPFAGLLLSMALLPLLAPTVWHKHMNKIVVLWVLAAMVPMGMNLGITATSHSIAHTIIKEYIPFIALISTLFIICGGIVIDFGHVSTKNLPWINLGYLTLGTLLAGWIGTMGASMILIRPLIRANHWRRNYLYLVIAFIWLVANIGGALTPLGDPPLLLGFLHGIDFFWTVKALGPLMLVAITPILLGCWWLDRYYLKRETTVPAATLQQAKFLLLGKSNFGLLALAVGNLLFSNHWPAWFNFDILGVAVTSNEVIRVAVFGTLMWVSWRYTNPMIHKYNEFIVAPLYEVIVLFIGIFVTLIPVLDILHQPDKIGPLLRWLYHADGTPNNLAYFWLTGLLSAFLDNAPTYLIFFHLAGGDPHQLMTTLGGTLTAISAGSVFMGAMSYIGNAPNLVIASIARQHQVPMPSFFGYVGISFGILGSLLFIISYCYFR